MTAVTGGARPPVRRSARALAGGLIALTLGLVGCPDRFARPDDFEADPAPLLAAVRAHGEAIQSLSAELTLEVWRDRERVRLRQLVIVERPDRLRIDSLSPFDQPLSTLVSDGQTLSIYALEDQRFYQGRASPENLVRLVPIRLEPRELGALLRGEVPLIDHREATVSWVGATGRYRLDLVGEGQRQRVEFEPLAKRVTETRVWRGERLAYAARLGDYSGTDLTAIPRRMRFESPADGLQIDVVVQAHQVNRAIPAAAFTLSVPRGVEIEPL